MDLFSLSFSSNWGVQEPSDLPLFYSSNWEVQGVMDFLSLVNVGIRGPFSYWSNGAFRDPWIFFPSPVLLSLSYWSKWSLQGSLDLLSRSYILVKMGSGEVLGSYFPLLLVKMGSSVQGTMDFLSLSYTSK